jgi:hypothetical protein
MQPPALSARFRLAPVFPQKPTSILCFFLFDIRAVFFTVAFKLIRQCPVYDRHMASYSLSSYHRSTFFLTESRCIFIFNVIIPQLLKLKIIIFPRHIEL